ncbi:mannosyltransferase family protein [Dactylosporangium sp. NPDC000555]|uniref:mannosyltransferase family protein n=1 Tax=Dactylosporangium sp. NPDC000555 TaxID=3154260 RepID=UPI00331F7A41
MGAADGPWRRALLSGLAIFAASRAGLVAVSAFAWIGDQGRHRSAAQVARLWATQYDSPWFIAIAEHGYQRTGDASPAAFFPLYPLLIRLFTPLCLGRSWVAALLVANAALLAALIVLFRLTEHELGRAAAGRTIFYLVAFPTAFFLSAAYNEGLFIALLTATVYCLRREHWWRAGALGALAAATRSAGILLLFAFAFEYARTHGYLRPRTYFRSQSYFRTRVYVRARALVLNRKIRRNPETPRPNLSDKSSLVVISARDATQEVRAHAGADGSSTHAAPHGPGADAGSHEASTRGGSHEASTHAAAHGANADTAAHRTGAQLEAHDAPPEGGAPAATRGAGAYVATHGEGAHRARPGLRRRQKPGGAERRDDRPAPGGRDIPRGDRAPGHHGRIAASAPAMLLIPLGLGAVMIADRIAYGDALAFSHTQAAHWGRHLAWPWRAPIDAARAPGPPFTEIWTHNLLELATVALLGVLLVLALAGPWRLRRDQLLFPLLGAALLIFMISFPSRYTADIPYPLYSASRIGLEVFPAFMMLGRMGRNRWLDRTLLAAFLATQGVLAAHFLHSGWVA